MQAHSDHGSDEELASVPSLATLPSALVLDAEEFAMLLKERREKAGLSQRQLAQLAGISEPTLRSLEHAKHGASEDTLKRLFMIPQLDLSPEQLPTRRKAFVESELDYFNKLNCFVAPDYGLFELWLDFRRQLNTEGGHIEQTYLYLEPEAAYAYLEACNHTRFMVAHHVNMPLEAMVGSIWKAADSDVVDVVALGTGDAQQEVRLVRHLLERSPRLRLRLHLLDISHPMLNIAYKHASDSLGRFDNVFIAQIQANFHNLAAYQQFFYTPAFDKRRRIFVMLGGTFANVDNEIRFVRNSLGNATVGDMLLIDVLESCGSTDEEIRQNDQKLRRPPTELDSWLGGMVRRYCCDAKSVVLRLELRHDCVIPESYAVDAVARVSFPKGKSRDISMARAKRYQLSHLCNRLEQEGWKCLETIRYGANPPPMSALLLFQKIA